MRFATSSQTIHHDRDSAVPIEHTRIHTDDLDEIRDWENSQGIQSERRQLSRGSRRYEADFFDFRQLFAWRYREPHRLLHEFILPPGSIEICFARSTDALAWRGKQFANSIAAIHCGGEVYDGVVPPGCVLYGFVFPQSSDLVRSLLPEETLDLALKNQAVASARPEILSPSFQALDALLLSDPADLQLPAATDLIVECCHKLVESCFPGGRSRGENPKKGLIDDARDLITLHLCDPLTVAILSQQLGVTRRTLERAFQTQLGVTPYQFLLVERLHAAQRLLKAGDQSVLDCCHQSGFDDASRFSRMYARHFGELPTQTKSRSL